MSSWECVTPGAVAVEIYSPTTKKRARSYIGAYVHILSDQKHHILRMIETFLCIERAHLRSEANVGLLTLSVFLKEMKEKSM